jgi:Flp pilus assembly protein CpaB
LATNPSVITREAGTSAPVRRLGRRRPSLSHILIGLAVVLAFGLNYLALQDRTATVLVALTSADMPAGSVLSRANVELSGLPADSAFTGNLITEADLATVDGWILTRSVPAGTLLDHSSLVPPASESGGRLMSIPIPAEHAAGASIEVGDTVDIVSTSDGAARFIAQGLRVVQVADTETGALGGSGYFVVVDAEPDQILEISEALASGSLEIIRSTGAPPIPSGG